MSHTQPKYTTGRRRVKKRAASASQRMQPFACPAGALGRRVLFGANRSHGGYISSVTHTDEPPMTKPTPEDDNSSNERREP